MSSILAFLPSRGGIPLATTGESSRTLFRIRSETASSSIPKTTPFWASASLTSCSAGHGLVKKGASRDAVADILSFARRIRI